MCRGKLAKFTFKHKQDPRLSYTRPVGATAGRTIDNLAKVECVWCSTEILAYV